MRIETDGIAVKKKKSMEQTENPGIVRELFDIHMRKKNTSPKKVYRWHISI